MLLDNSRSDYEAVVLHDYIISTITKAQIASVPTLDKVIASLKADLLPAAEDNNERNILSSLITFLETEKNLY